MTDPDSPPPPRVPGPASASALPTTSTSTSTSIQPQPAQPPVKKRSHHKKPDRSVSSSSSSAPNQRGGVGVRGSSSGGSFPPSNTPTITTYTHSTGQPTLLNPHHLPATSSSSSRVSTYPYNTLIPPSVPVHSNPYPYTATPHRPPPPRLDVHADRESRGIRMSLREKRGERERGMERLGYSLRPSSNNRLFLSLRSTLPSEITYAMDELIRLSHTSRLNLRDFPGSVEVVLDWIERWVARLEREVDDGAVMRGTHTSSSGLGLDETKDEADEREKALDALLILRNSVCMDGEWGQGNRQVVLWVKERPIGLDQMGRAGGRTGGAGAGGLAVPLPPRIVGILTRVFGGLDRRAAVAAAGGGTGACIDEEEPPSSLDHLTKLMLDQPEPLVYLLDILIALVPCLVDLLDQPEVPSVAVGQEDELHETDPTSPPTTTTAMLTARHLRPLLFDILPRLLLITGDVAFIVPLCQLFSLIPASYLPTVTLVPRLVSFLLLTPSVGSGRINRTTGKMETTPSPFPPEILTHSLNLLYHLTRETSTSIVILKHPHVVDYLRILTRLLKWDARELVLALKHTGPAGKWVDLPEPGALRMISVERRDPAQAARPVVVQTKVLGVGLKQDDGLDETGEKVGLGRVIRMSEEKRKRIRAMREPDRAHAWMAETFVSQPDSSVTQVIFWKAYSAFVQQMPNEPAIPLSGTAGEVIKSATSVFPGANAMVITRDKQGNPLAANLFVIAGMRFRRGPGTHQTYACRWDGCTTGQTHKTPADLYAHLQATHGSDPNASCRWTACRSKSVSASHFLTHVPAALGPTREPGIRRLLNHPESSVDSVQSTFVTYRPPPLLPREYSLHYTSILSPVDNKGQPASDAFYASLILRNLGKALRMDLERAEIEQEDADPESGRRARKRRKMEREGAFGLPAPPGLLDADLVSSDLTGGSGDVRLDDDERTRARDAFSGIVEKTVLEVLGMEGTIAGRLLDCIGF